MSTVIVGQPATQTANFTVAGTLTDPTLIYFSYQTYDNLGNPENAKVTWEYGVTGSIAKTSTGIYTATLVPVLAGQLYIRWVGTGACVAAFDDILTVLPAALFPP